MAIELYWGSGSPFAWRVMLTLEVKGLAYESKLLEFSKGEHKTPAYLQLNPRGKVPTLKDGDFVVYESLAMMAYLDRKYPNPPLFGKTPEETGLIWQTISECESYLVGEGNKVVRPMFFGKGLDLVDEIQQAAQTVRQEFKISMDVLANQIGWSASRSPPPISPCFLWCSCSCARPPKTPPGRSIWDSCLCRKGFPISRAGSSASKPCPITSALTRRTGDKRNDFMANQLTGGCLCGAVRYESSAKSIDERQLSLLRLSKKRRQRVRRRDGGAGIDPED